MQFKKLAFFIISVTILFTGCDSKNEDNAEVKKEIINKNKNEFKLITQDQQEINTTKTENGVIFKELEGKVVLLNFWATWCPPCKVEIPHLNTLKEKYNQELEVVAITLGERMGGLTPQDKLNEFISEYKINYLVTNSEANFKLADAMGGIRTIPTMFLFDKQGNLIQKYVGVVPPEMIEIDIKKALGNN